MARTAVTKRAQAKDEVNGLKMEPLQKSVQWMATVRLHQLNEDSESLLAETQWPPKTGPVYFACASTGLLFDKQSGRCLQSSQVSLLLDTVKPIVGSARGLYKSWRDRRIAEQGVFNHSIGKRGPKTKAQKEYAAAHENDVGDGDATFDE